MIYQKEIPVKGEYDVIVCGGGYSGFAAAYSAAREGLRVLLVESGSCLGGVGTAGLVSDILGQRHLVNGAMKDSVRGIFSLLEQRILSIDGAAVDAKMIHYDLHPHGWYSGLGTGLIYDNEYMKHVLETMLREVGAEILYYTSIIDAVTTKNENGRHIDGIVVSNKGGLGLLCAECFVDATGDGDICTFCQVPYALGDEEGGLAAASLEMHVDHVDDRVLWEYMEQTNDLRFRAIISRLRKEGIWNFPYDIFISVQLAQKGVYMINTIRQVGVNGVDPISRTAATIDGRTENLQLLAIMRAHFPGFAGARLRAIAPVIGIRETRRIAGDYTLTVEDLINGVVFDDSIAVSSYGWDLPHPKHPSVQPSEHVRRRTHYTHIPYRCLLPKSVSNLIMAGRCISVEREVLGPVRVMGPCLAMGECAGIASAMAIRDAAGIYRHVDVPRLQQRIVHFGGITAIHA